MGYRATERRKRVLKRCLEQRRVVKRRREGLQLQRICVKLQYCSFETCGEFTGNIHMNSPQENSPWGIPLGESDSLPQANWWIHEECPGNQIHGEFPMVNSPWWILHWDSLGNSWWWIPHRKFPMVNSSRRIILGK